MNYKEISQYLKVIADSSRLEILDLLSCGELFACDLLEHFSFSQPTLSHHMKVLKDNNLITSRKDGNKNLYKLNHDVLDDVTSRLTLLGSSTVPCICETVEKGEC
ncbi:ArsR/SmtB family transcription factor [Staphylococcus cohnii]|uniref:ArsR/SmtB family transcription factor n=1 Tax=Staphylococcus cohnii TaxID=29382 RepID=UPI003D08D9BB